MKRFAQFIREQEEKVRTAVLHANPFKPDGSIRSNSIVAKKTTAHKDLSKLLGHSDQHTTFSVHAKSDGIPSAIGHDEHGPYIEVGKHGKLRSAADVNALRPAMLEKDKTGGAFTEQRIGGLHEVVDHFLSKPHPLTEMVKKRGTSTRLHGELFWNSLAKGETPDEPGSPGVRTYVMTPYSKQKTAGTKGGFTVYSGQLNKGFSEKEISKMPEHSTSEVKITHDILPTKHRELSVPAEDLRKQLKQTDPKDHQAIAEIADQFHKRARGLLEKSGYKDPWSHQHIQPWGEGVVLRKKTDPQTAIKITSPEHQRGMYDQLYNKRVATARKQNPQIANQDVHHHVTIGSMSVPTVGHGGMVRHMVNAADKLGNVGKVVVGMMRSSKTSPSPLSQEEREMMLRHTAGNPSNVEVAHVSGIGGALHPILNHVLENAGPKQHLHLHIGPDDKDKAEDIKKQVESGSMMFPRGTFHSITIHTAESRELVDGKKVSGTRAREAIASKNEPEAAKLTGMQNHPKWKNVWNKLSSSAIKVRRG